MISKILIALVRIYQNTFSLFFPPSCRFTPSCSQYMIDAILKYGALVGVFKGLSRLASCHPFSKKSGCDIA